MNLRFRNRDFMLVILLGIVVLSGWLGSRGLNEPDEGRFAEISREMALQKDWLIPHLNGVPHFQKPPLTYWITAIFIRLLGANEWAVRLTPALAAFGTLLLTMYIAWVLYGEQCRWKAGLILLTSTGFFAVARLITTDMLLTFCITAAVAGLIGYAQQGRKAWLGVFYVGMGLGFLAKGPLGILIPGVAAAVVQAARWRRRTPVRLYWWLGMPVALLLGLSWYLALIHRDRSLFDYFFRYELIDRVATNVHNRSKPVWFYPGALILCMIPWSGFAFFLPRTLWRRRRDPISTNSWFLIGWLGIPYLILSLVVSKLVTYLIPLLPPLAIIVARWLEHPSTGDCWRRPARYTAWILGLFLLAFPVIRLFFVDHALSFLELPFGFWLAMFCATVSLLLLGNALGKGLALRPFLFWMATTWAAVMLTLASQADTLMTGGNAPVRKIMETIRQLDPDGTTPVFVYKTRAYGTEFYLRRLVYRGYDNSNVVFPLKGDLLRRIVRDEPRTVLSFGETPAFVLIKKDHHLKSPHFRKWYCVEQVDSWLLLTNRPLPRTLSRTAVDQSL